MKIAHLIVSLAALGAAAGSLAQTETSVVPATAEGGPTTANRSSTREFRPLFKAGADNVLAEVEALPDAPGVDGQVALRGTPYLLWRPARDWELRAGVRIEGTRQNGDARQFTRWTTELEDTYVRYRSGDTRLTLGAQTIVWGRIDEFPVIDRVSRADLTRFLLDDLEARRLALPALRWEQAMNDFKLDAVVLPAFSGAALPDLRSVWSPINQQTGEVLGIESSPGLSAFVRNAQVLEDESGSGGGALRLTHAGSGGISWGATMARTRQSVPYYQADPLAMTLTAVHPFVRFAGLDAEMVLGEVTLRTEVGWSDGVPFTSLGGQLLPRRVVEWVGAMEFFPGGEDARVNLQLAARSVQGAQQILELKDYVAVNGEWEAKFDQGRWKAGLRFNLGLNVRDVYLAPKLSYLGWEPHEAYVLLRHFDGESRTFGGFHQDHQNFAVGLSTRF